MSLVNIDNTIVDCVLINNAEKYIIEKNPGPKQAAKKQLTKMGNKNKQVNTAKNVCKLIFLKFKISYFCLIPANTCHLLY